MTNKFKIEIEAEKLAKGSMFLHEQIASGEVEGKKFTLDSIIPSHSMVLSVGEFEEGQRYLVPIREIVSSLLDFHFEKGKDIKVAEMRKIKQIKQKI